MWYVKPSVTHCYTIVLLHYSYQLMTKPQTASYFWQMRSLKVHQALLSKCRENSKSNHLKCMLGCKSDNSLRCSIKNRTLHTLSWSSQSSDCNHSHSRRSTLNSSEIDTAVRLNRHRVRALSGCMSPCSVCCPMEVCAHSCHGASRVLSPHPGSGS